MDINPILNNINLSVVVYWFIKTLGIVGAIVYFIFVLVVNKQTQVMKKTIQIDDKNILTLIAAIQLFLAGFLIISIIFFI